MKILYNAHIYTLDDSHPVVSAIVVEHGRIKAIGETEKILSEYDRGKKQDIGGKIILPGLTDAHLHLQKYALSLQKINCETDTLGECLDRVKKHINTANPAKGFLVTGGIKTFGMGGLPIRNWIKSPRTTPFISLLSLCMRAGLTHPP